MDKSSLPKAVVLSCSGGSQGDLSVVRTLGREGVPVTVISEYKHSVALVSRYCNEPIYIKGFSSDHEKAVDFLIMYAKKQVKKPVLFPTADPDLAFLSEQKDKLEKYYHFFISSKYIIENFMDKSKFFHLANKHNFSIPFTYTPKNIDEVIEVSNKIQYPAILKPSFPPSWSNKNIQIIVNHKKAVTVNSKDELIGLYKKITEYNKDMVIQEYIHGGDDDLYSLHIYMDKNSEPVAYFTGRKIRTYPTYAGIGCFVQSIYVEDIIKEGIRMLKQVHYTGVALLQFKRDSRTGEFKLLEVNPRVSSWNLLAYECGINLPFIAYADTVGVEFKKPGRQKEDVKYVYLKNDFKAFLDYRKNGVWTLGSWLNSLKGKKVYQFYASDDLKPSLVTMFRNIKKLI